MTKLSVVHNATVEHLASGWLRWRASCPCGWTRTPKHGGQVAANELALLHNKLNGVAPDGDVA